MNLAEQVIINKSVLVDKYPFFRKNANRISDSFLITRSKSYDKKRILIQLNIISLVKIKLLFIMDIHSRKLVSSIQFKFEFPSSCVEIYSISNIFFYVNIERDDYFDELGERCNCLMLDIYSRPHKIPYKNIEKQIKIIYLKTKLAKLII